MRIRGGSILVIASLIASAAGVVPSARADQGLSRDSDFGSGGRVLVSDALGNPGRHAVTSQSDGRILVLTSDGQPESSFMRRYTAEGQIDSSFGTDGTVPFPQGSTPIAWRLPTDPSAPIYVLLTTPTEQLYIVRKYLANGTPDNGFGTAGDVQVSFTNVTSIASMAVATNGVIAVASVRWDGTNQHTTIKRLTAGGAADGSFGSGGTATLAGLTGDLFAVDGSGRPLLLHDDRADFSRAVVRVSATGTLDSGFGTGGFADIAGITDNITGELLPDGKVLAVSRSYGADGYLARVVRFTAGGDPDATFGEGGMVDIGFLDLLPSIANTTDFTWPRGLAVLPDGRVAVFATSFGQATVAVLLSNGTFDPDFGEDGRAVLSNDVELLAGAATPEAILFVAARVNQLGVFLQRSTQSSPWPPVSPPPSNFVATVVEQPELEVGDYGTGLRGTWSAVVHPDPEVEDYGYLFDVEPDVSRSFPLFTTSLTAGLTPIPPGTYTVSVRAVNEYTVGLPAETTVTIPAPPYVPLEPARLFDSRPNTSTVDGDDGVGGILAAGSIARVQVAGRAGVRPSASSAVLNVTVTEPFGPGYVTVYPCTSTVPTASSVNFVAGQTVPNAVLAKLDDSGAVCLFTSAPTHLVVDVNGFEPRWSDAVPISPARLVETRSGLPTVDGVSAGIGQRGRGSVTEVQIAGRADTPVDASTAVLNVTVTDPTDSGFLTAYPCSANVPTASSLNFVAGQTTANSVITKLSPTGSVCLYTTAPTDVVVDISGSRPSASTYVPLSPARLLDTRQGMPTIDGIGSGIGQRASGTITELQVAGRGGTASTASTAVLNVTVTEPDGPGFVTVYPCTAVVPTASSLNYVAGQTVPNAVVATLSPRGTICILNTAATHIVVDINGFHPSR